MGLHFMRGIYGTTVASCAAKIGLTLVTLLVAATCAFAESSGPALQPDEDGIVFVIGKLDGNRVEFQREGWAGISEFECTAGVDCAAETFPMRLQAPSAMHWDDLAVQTIRVNFWLGEPLLDAQLTFARAGNETSVVSLDDKIIGTFTHDMFGAGEGQRYGRLKIALGGLDAGHHYLDFAVAEDTTGNLRHSIDAILLNGKLGSQTN